MKDTYRLSRAVSPVLVILQALVLIALAIVTWRSVSDWHYNDLALYYTVAVKLAQGQLPYRDFPMEYPPLAVLPFALPYLSSFGSPLTEQRYIWRFLSENALFSIIITLAISRIALYVRPGRSTWPSLLAYTLLVGIMAPLLPWRYDLFPSLLVALALLGVLIDRPVLAGVCLGWGLAAKLYPVILLPIFGAYYLVNGRWRTLLSLTVATVAAAAVTMLPFLSLDPSETFSFLRYHQLRGLQIESLPAGILSLGQVLGIVHFEIVYNYGALHVGLPLADRLAHFWLPVLFLLSYGMLLALCLRSFYQERRQQGQIRPESLLVAIVAALLVFIVTNKVFSPQYLIWLLPLMPLLRLRYMALFMLICGLTITVFPFLYQHFLDGEVLPILLLNLRNLLLLALIPWLLLSCLPARFDQPLPEPPGVQRSPA